MATAEIEIQKDNTNEVEYHNYVENQTINDRLNSIAIDLMKTIHKKEVENMNKLEKTIQRANVEQEIRKNKEKCLVKKQMLFGSLY